MNTVNITGRLTRDPDMRYTAAGKAVANFTVACNRMGGSGAQTADFINCVAWEKTADLIANHFKKGNQIGVTGSIRTGSYQRDDGQKVYTWNVQVQNIDFLETKAAAAKSAQSSERGSQPRNQDPFDGYQGMGEEIEINDDDLPF